MTNKKKILSYWQIKQAENYIQGSINNPCPCGQDHSIFWKNRLKKLKSKSNK